MSSIGLVENWWDMSLGMEERCDFVGCRWKGEVDFGHIGSGIISTFPGWVMIGYERAMDGRIIRGLTDGNETWQSYIASGHRRGVRPKSCMLG